MAPVKVIIVDDDDAMRETLARFLTQEGYEVIQAANGSTLSEEQLAQGALVLLDVNLPGENGFDVARRIRAWCPSIGIIMLTGRGELVDRVLGLELGADDYVHKPFELRELLARMRSILRRTQVQIQRQAITPVRGGCEPVPPPLQFEGWTVHVGSRKVVAPCGREVNLTTTEFDILKLLSDNRGQSVSRQRLYEVLRAKEWSPLDRTLDTHVANLRRKLESTGGGSLIKTVHGLGYVLAVDE